MDPCHSVSYPRPPAITSAVTVAHLIRNIEQLRNKDKLISQLEKDLGKQWVAAHLAALEREFSEGAPDLGALSHPLGVLPEDSLDPCPFPRTPTSTPATGGVEEARSCVKEGNTSDKHDLSRKAKGYKEKNKLLLEKCRAYLHKNKELTAQNRAYKDSNDQVLQENKKMHELLEHSKLRVLQLTRCLSEAQEDKSGQEQQTETISCLKKELVEDKKVISALREACVNKDRRIELIQHRKRKRRLAGPAEKVMGVKETFFGYLEDPQSMDSDRVCSSHSPSNISEEDSWDQVFSMEETERNYHKLMKEHLQLQKSHAQLYKHNGNLQDPQREAMTKVTLQNDLFNAQCQIEQLESAIKALKEGEMLAFTKEREAIMAIKTEQEEKATFWENESRRLQTDLSLALEQCEDLEFQLMEREQAEEDEHENIQSRPCTDSCQHLTPEFLEQLSEVSLQQQVTVQTMEQLRQELALLLKGRGMEGDAVLKRLDAISQDEKKRALSLESIATELQMKVISLQKEKDVLWDQISHTGQKQGKGNQSASFAAARERQENLELKNQVAELSCSESKLLAERLHLQEQLQHWKSQYETLKQQLDTSMAAVAQQAQPASGPGQVSERNLPSLAQTMSKRLMRKSSKDRKPKSSAEDEPVDVKRRKCNKDLMQSVHADTESHHVQVPSNSISDSCMNCFSKVQPMEETVDESEMLRQALDEVKAQARQMLQENYNLQDQLKQCVLERSQEVEADQQLLLNRAETSEKEVALLRKENVALGQRLKQRMEDYQEEVSPRMAELEEYCEELQERLRASEMAERQSRDRLRMAEKRFDDAESNEISLREKYEEQKARGNTLRRQVQELQRTGREIRDTMVDKEIVEQALRDKIDFLQKAEAYSAKRIDELEAIEKELREQLGRRVDHSDSSHRELNKIQELKHQITFLETDNKALQARIAELEDNEETLRENWRRVADEDFNRTESLQEKVKMLEGLNRDLKSKLVDAQEVLVINAVPASQNSLAAELAQIQTRTRRAATFDDGDSDEDMVDSSVGHSAMTSQSELEKKNLKEKLKKLERQLSDVAEEKNTKIESLQEKIVGLKENEVKLSETIAELEMTERELRAKLALYESSEVTVEKMLKYQSKIEELRTSQESLLDQLESMENQGMTLQEQMQEMERTLRGKIVTLEVEMKGFKQRELKDAARIRELEKQEKELTEKVALQAEKENSLYVKISSLMDEVKKAKEELNTVRANMLEKEDKVRKANLLEVKFLEKEMEYGKKISSLSTKLRHKEEELRQKEVALQEERASAQQELAEKDVEVSQRIQLLEAVGAQKESELQATIRSLREDRDILTEERDEFMRQVNELSKRNTDLNDKDFEYTKELDILKQEVASIHISESEYKEKTQKHLEEEKLKTREAENKVVQLEKEVSKEKETIFVLERQLAGLRNEINEKLKHVEICLLEKESEFEKQKSCWQAELSRKEVRVKELEKELTERVQSLENLDAECEQLRSQAEVAQLEHADKLADLGMVLFERDERLKEIENRVHKKEADLEQEIKTLKTKNDELSNLVVEKDNVIKNLNRSLENKEAEFKMRLAVSTEELTSVQTELKQRLQFLNAQLLHEAEERERQHTALEQAEVREHKLSSEVRELMTQVAQLEHQSTQRSLELETIKREKSQLSDQLDQLTDSLEIAEREFATSKDLLQQTQQELHDQIIEQNKSLNKYKQDIQTAETRIQNLQSELSRKDQVIEESAAEKNGLLVQKQREIELLVQEKLRSESLMQEHAQKSEEVLLQSQSEERHREQKLKELKEELQEKMSLLEQSVHDRAEMQAQILSLQSQIQNLSQNLDDSSLKLSLLTAENQNYLEEIQNLKRDKEAITAQAEVTHKELLQKQNEAEMKMDEQRSSQSQVSSKQLELDQARAELQKCLQEIEEFRSRAHIKDVEMQQQNHKCQEMSSELEVLSVQVQEQSQEYQQLESKCGQVEGKLVEAENRYRQLEARCAQLELQLQESFSQLQFAEELVGTREAEYQQLDNQLSLVKKDFDAAAVQMQEAERVILLKEKTCQQLEAKLEESKRECEEMKNTMVEKENKLEQAVNKLSSLETEHMLLKSESNTLHQEFAKTQTQREGSQSEVMAVKQQVADLKAACDRKVTELAQLEQKLQETLASKIITEQLLKEAEVKTQNAETDLNSQQSECRSLEAKCRELDTRLRDAQKLIVDLENKVKENNTFRNSLQDEINTLNLKYTESKASLSQVEKDRMLQSSELDRLSLKLKKTEQDLIASQELCDMLSEKLKSAESQLTEKTDQVASLKAEMSQLQKSLSEQESLKKDSQAALQVLQQEHAQLKAEQGSQIMDMTDSLTEKNILMSDLMNVKSDLDRAQKQCMESQTSFFNLQSQFEQTQSSLISNVSLVKIQEGQMLSLEESLRQMETSNSHLTARNEQLIQQLEEKERACKDLSSELEVTRQQLGDLTSQLKQASVSSQEVFAQLNTCRQQHVQALSELEDLQKQMNLTIANNEQKYAALERLCQTLQDEIQTKTNVIDSLKSSEDKLAFSISSLNEENMTLKGKLEKVSTETHSSESQLWELIETNQRLSGQLYQMNVKLQSNDQQMAEISQNESQFQVERDGLVRRVEQLVDEKRRLEENNKTLADDLKMARSELEKLRSSPKGQVSFNQSDHTKRHFEDDVVKDSDVFVSVNSVSLQAQPNIVLANSAQVRTAASHVCGDVSSIGKMVSEIEAYQKADIEHQEKLCSLEQALKEMREREGRSVVRVLELESREAELLKQMADIEATVIVPLELETQELKDELSMVKQERDEAQARSSKWVDEDGEQPDLEVVHKSLEDALIHKDELEKKIEILSNDIAVLEQDKDQLMKQIIDLEASSAEQAEKIEFLDDEVERLHGLERATSVVEESETCLMDRVLDLEEKEQQLLAELALLKGKPSKSHGGEQTDGQPSYSSLLEKVKHLELNNSLLLDAEGRYMDKIVELEELHHRLQSELLSLRSSPGNGDSENLPIVSTGSVLLLMQNTPSEGGNDSSQSDASSQTVSSDLGNLIYKAEENLTPTEHYKELESRIQELTAECASKTGEIQYLQEKCELMLDSEARLMEQLSDQEQMMVSQKGQQGTSDGDMKKRLDSVTEENEFLAESVENYKKLYKDEKEKVNYLHDQLMENSSLVHELHEAKAELKATQMMVEEIQSEYEEQLAVKEEHQSYLSNLLTQTQLREKELQTQLFVAQQQLDQHRHEAKLLVDHKLDTDLTVGREQELLKQIELLRAKQEQQQAAGNGLENQLKYAEQERLELQRQLTDLTSREQELRGQVTDLRQREQSLVSQLQEARARAETASDTPEEDSLHSDSGFSDHRTSRYPNQEPVSKDQSLSQNQSPSQQSPVSQKVFSSSLTLNLSQSPGSSLKRNLSSLNGASHSPTEPIAPPRRGRSRRSSIDSISHEELFFQVEELQNRESALKRRLHELEALADTDLFHRVEELQLDKQNLERKLVYAESQISRLVAQEEKSFTDKNVIVSYEDSNNNKKEQDSQEEEIIVLSSQLKSATMLDKPEDVLHKRIKELENLDRHHKNQVEELEKDRQVLHELARKDKSTIHDLNVKIRELQLSEQGLQKQMSILEASENSLFSKCEELQTLKTKLEDRVYQLSAQERQLQELLHKSQLDQDHRLGHSEGMETAVAELAANERQLRRLLQDAEVEKGGLVERAEYMEVRVQELQSAEAMLIQQIKSFENKEVSLQSRLVQLEKSERAAYNKVSELDMLNMDLSDRLHRTLEDNVVLSQHVTQMQGQINELERRLMSFQDSELAYKQLIESLEKNEGSLQKKIREFELREIDSQAVLRELEHRNEILNDKLTSLQRSDNQLRFRVQELEAIVAQGSKDSTTLHKQKIPQKLDDCQKLIVLLQNQVESLQLQLRQALRATQTKPVSKVDDSKKVYLSTDEFRQLKTRSALLEETIYHNEQIERVNQELSETILRLKQGKAASGHEVEIEVLKRRLASYKTFVTKLKSSLSNEQATSLWDPELDSGLQGDTLPARQLHGLESERVLQSVRGLQDGKADSSKERGAQQTGLLPETADQSKATSVSASLPAEVDADADTPEQSSRWEESHWRAIEARKPKLVAGSRGGANATVGIAAQQAAPTHGSKPSSTPEVEELTVSLHLQSESELSSHHRTQPSDTDSSLSPIPPPRRVRGHRASKSIHASSSSLDSSDGAASESSTSLKAAAATNSNDIFGTEKSLPFPASNKLSREHTEELASLTRFEGGNSLSQTRSLPQKVGSPSDRDVPPLPKSEPPRADKVSPIWKEGSSGTKDSEDSLSGLSIKDRIARIENKYQTADTLKQVEKLGKDNKHLKDDISRLEKELEDKQNYINLFELWISNLEEMLKNKDKQTDRQLVEQLHQQLTKLRTDQKIGQSTGAAGLDNIAEQTEQWGVQHAMTNKIIEMLTGELKQCQNECENIEGMRQKTLDSLRRLDLELVDLQERERQWRQDHRQLRLIKTQYDQVEQDKQQALTQVQTLQARLDRLTKTCQERDALMRRLGTELRRSTYRPSSALDELKNLDSQADKDVFHSDFPSAIEGSAPLKAGRYRHNSSSSSVDEPEIRYPFSDSDCKPAKSSTRLRPTPYDSRPRSVEPLTSRSRVQRGTHAHPGSAPEISRSRAAPQALGPDGYYLTVADYDPALFSQSGRPGLDLPLREGELVRVLGPKDMTGYFEAEASGRVGLAPSSYLQPLYGGHTSVSSQAARIGGHRGSGDGRLPNLYPAGNSLRSDEVRNTFRPLHPGPAADKSNIGTIKKGRRSLTTRQQAEPPSNLHVKGIVGDNSILLSWLPPRSQLQDSNNQMVLMGYKVYLDNREYAEIANPAQCQIVVDQVSLGQPHHLAVSCLYGGGLVSPTSELVFEGIVRMVPGQESSDQGHQQEEVGTNLSSVLSNVRGKLGPRKTMMALYDYNPEEQSPLDYPSLELAFQSGQIIHVYGEPRPDGFLHGEVEGKHGFVPACFIEEV